MLEVISSPPDWGEVGGDRWAILSALLLQMSEGRIWVERNKVFVLSGLDKGPAFDTTVNKLVFRGWLVQRKISGIFKLSLHTRAASEFSRRITTVRAQKGWRNHH